MKLLRYGICLLAAFAVFAHGAVEAWSQGVLAIGGAALLIVWGVLVAVERESRVRWNPLLWPLAGFIGVALVQMLGGLTVYTYLTRIELLKFGALCVLAFLAVQAFRTREEWKEFVWFLLILGFVVSLLGILQHFTFNGKLYWVREMRYGGIPFGPYVNRNHFAGFLELAIPPGLALLVLRGLPRDQRPLVALFTVVPVGALFLSASRGGIASFLVQVGLIVALVVLLRRDAHKSLVAAAAILLLAGAMVAWLGVGRALERFSKFESLEVTESRRLVMAKDSLRIFREHPLLGTGLGTLQAVYPFYESFYDGKVVNHAHNDYVEVLAEMGLAGGLCGLSFLVIFFRRGLGHLQACEHVRDLAVYAGPFVACSGMLAHSLVDFNLRIPANALIFLLQAILVCTAWPRALDHFPGQ